MVKWEAHWSGGWPALCVGEWALYEDGKEVDVEIPFQGESACTFGSHCQWYFNSDWLEEFEEYEDGEEEEDWIESNKQYLREVTEDETQWPLIYKAFQAEDFREGECGGCI